MVSNPFSYSKKSDPAAEISASGTAIHEIVGELSISYNRFFQEVVEENIKQGDGTEIGKKTSKNTLSDDKRDKIIEKFEARQKYFFEKILEEQKHNRMFAYWVLVIVFVSFVIFIISRLLPK